MFSVTETVITIDENPYKQIKHKAMFLMLDRNLKISNAHLCL